MSYEMRKWRTQMKPMWTWGEHAQMVTWAKDQIGDVTSCTTVLFLSCSAKISYQLTKRTSLWKWWEQLSRTSEVQIWRIPGYCLIQSELWPFLGALFPCEIYDWNWIKAMTSCSASPSLIEEWKKVKVHTTTIITLIQQFNHFTVNSLHVNYSVLKIGEIIVKVDWL